jgi:hypothetical protein
VLFLVSRWVVGHARPSYQPNDAWNARGTTHILGDKIPKAVIPSYELDRGEVK